MNTRLGGVNAVMLMLPDDGHITVEIEPCETMHGRPGDDYTLPNGTKARIVLCLPDDQCDGNGLFAAIQCMELTPFSRPTPMEALGWILGRVASYQSGFHHPAGAFG